MDKTEKKMRNIMPTIEQWETIKEAARKQGKSFSAFCVEASLKEAKRVNK